MQERVNLNAYRMLRLMDCVLGVCRAWLVNRQPCLFLVGCGGHLFWGQPCLFGVWKSHRGRLSVVSREQPSWSQLESGGECERK